MRSLSARERKLVAVLLLIGALALLHLIVVGPIVDGFRERADRREMLVRQYQANQRLVDSMPRLRRWAEQQRASLRDFVLNAANPAAASVALQERLQNQIEAAGGELRSVEEAAAGEGLVGARASVRMTLDQLTRLLNELQNRPPYLNVEALSVSADQALISNRLDILEVSLEVSVPSGPATA